MSKKPKLRNTMVILSLLTVVVLAGSVISPVYGQKSSGAQRLIFPLKDQLITVFPCTNDVIRVTSGYMQIVVQGFENEDGSRRLSVTNVNLVGVQGVGEFSSIPYQIRSASHETSVYHEGQEARTVTGTLNLFIEGGGHSLMHTTGHFTYNPNGQLTVDFFNEAGNCS
jgi:hypothetical protein